MLEPVLVVDPAVDVVEWVAHAARLGTPQLGIERLDLLQLGVQGGGLTRERDEGGVLRLQGGGNRCRAEICTRPQSAPSEQR